ncbi:MAG: right-handed parallel beta-helix repeat-containing protein [Methanothrix sp.]|nr:right-handed parallel beta-helix repeat-containing protein [Methanothrix sp.]
MLRIPMIIFMALLIWLMPTEGARTYIVDDSGFANFNTIQEAVVAASNGDTIYIKPGEYNEEVILNRSLKLMPLTGENGPIILKGDGLETGITITAEGCSLQGLTIQDFAGPAIYIQSSRNSIRENVFKNANPAILVRGSHENTITANTIMDSQGAVALWENSTNNQVSENDIVGCNLSIVVRETAENKILRNKISDAYWGLWLDHAEDCQIEGNDIQSKMYGVWVLNSSDICVSQNNVRIKGSTSGISQGINLANASGTILQGNEINDAAFGMLIFSSKNDKLMDNAIFRSTNAVFIKDSDSEVLKNNSIIGTEYGIRMENSSRNSLHQNKIENGTVGFDLGLSSQNNISENQLSGITDTAVQITSSNENTLSANRITDSSKGIILLESSANQLMANRFQNVEWSLYAEAETKEGFNNSIDESNVVDAVPIVYLFSRFGGQIQDRDIAHLTLAYCENVTVKNIAITNDAVFLFNSKNNRIQENNISGSFGMRLVQSNENEISGNMLLGNKFSGMFLYASDLNQIAGNNASRNNQNGISLLSCNQNIIADNVVNGNAATGIWLNLSQDNQVYKNNISNNPLGLQVMLSTGNKIFHNNFVGNQEHSQDIGGSNSWDEGNVTGGNYWSDHVAKGNPSRDWPRMIKGGSMLDGYPFQDESGWLRAAAA